MSKNNMNYSKQQVNRRRFLHGAGLTAMGALATLAPQWEGEGSPDEENPIPAGLARYTAEIQEKQQAKSPKYLITNMENGYTLRASLIKIKSSQELLVECIRPDGSVAWVITQPFYG